MSKIATPDVDVHELISSRWSPYAYDPEREVAPQDLRALFEAARWAASSYNEQPWRFVVGDRSRSPAAHEKVLGCLVEANQAWARQAPVLALGVISRTFARNGNENKAAPHDLGLAMGNLSLEATRRGLLVHQMIGISPETAQQTFGLPEGFEAFTAFALGYPADPASLDERLRERETSPRSRRPVDEFVFGEEWGVAGLGS